MPTTGNEQSCFNSIYLFIRNLWPTCSKHRDTFIYYVTQLPHLFKKNKLIASDISQCPGGFNPSTQQQVPRHQGKWACGNYDDSAYV